MAKGYTAVMTLKGGKTRRELFKGENAQARAKEYAEKEKKNSSSVMSVRVIKASEDDMRKDLKPGDPGYTGAEDDNKGKKFAEMTSEDFKDGHTHPIEGLDDDGNGTTGEAGEPPHSHEVKAGLVIPNTGGEGDESYISYHPGEVTLGAEDNDDDPNKNKPDENDPVPVDEAAAKLLEKYKERVKTMKLAELKGVEIFATGVHRDKTFVESDIDEIVANFETTGDLIKPPLVLGHDEDQKILQNSGLPSLGRPKVVYKTERGGTHFLTADFEDVPEVAREVIDQKKYSRISAELYEDFQHEGKGIGLTLRRVALLGGDIPEVKNMKDILDMSEIIKLGEPEGKLIYTESKGEPAMNKNDVKDPEARKAILKLQEENKSLAMRLAKDALATHRKDIGVFCDKAKVDGRVLPAWEDRGLRKFMESLDSDKTLKFAEGDDAVKMSALDFFKELIEGMPPIVQLEELAKQDPGGLQRIEGEKGVKNSTLDQHVHKYIEKAGEAGTKVGYAEAVRVVAKAHPELVEQA